MFRIRHFERQLPFGLNERALADVQENHGIDVDHIVVHRRLFLKIERFRYFGREDIYLSGLELFDFDIFFRFQLVDKYRAVFGGMVTSA